MDPTDHDILFEIRRGNTRKYSVLIDRYKDRGLALALRIVGSRVEAEEVLQDAFLRAYRGLADFREESAFGTWFYRILYNLCLTRVRRVHRKEGASDGSDDVSLEEVPADDDNGDLLGAIEECHLIGIVKGEIERLPEKYRIPLTLFYMQELSYEEIVKTMDLPMGTVKTNLFRARNLLRERVRALLVENGVAA